MEGRQGLPPAGVTRNEPASREIGAENVKHFPDDALVLEWYSRVLCHVSCVRDHRRELVFNLLGVKVRLRPFEGFILRERIDVG